MSLGLAVLLLLAGCAPACGPESVPLVTPEPEPATSPELETNPVLEADPGRETVEEFWPDGTPRLRKEILRLEDGRTVNHGSYARWHENGELAYEATYDQGRKEGRASRWHRNGQLWVEEHYREGEKHGTSRTWNEEGGLVKEERHAHGKPHGTWTVWEEGEIRARSCFDNGKPVPCDEAADHGTTPGVTDHEPGGRSQ